MITDLSKITIFQADETLGDASPLARNEISQTSSIWKTKVGQALTLTDSENDWKNTPCIVIGFDKALGDSGRIMYVALENEKYTQLDAYLHSHQID